MNIHKNHVISVTIDELELFLPLFACENYHSHAACDGDR
jgi:hypothetical protein